MAVRAPHLERQLPDLALPRDEGWSVAEAWAAVAIPPDRLDHMIRDTPSWTLWDPGVVGCKGEPASREWCPASQSATGGGASR